ncbi:MAG: glycerophosphodiester phosphodiesterase [Bdellovibrionota bacterium]
MNLFEKILNTTTNYYWGFTQAPYPTHDQRKAVKLIAHRGVHENKLALENTFKAFDLAVENHIWGIEFDVRFTKDNVPVVHHDNHLGRLFKKQETKVTDTNFSDLRILVPDIPSLSEMVQRYGKKIKLLIEIKQPEDSILTANNFLALENTLRLLRPCEDYYLLTLSPSLFDTQNFVSKQSVMCVDWRDIDNTVAQTLERNYGAVSGHFMLLNDKRLRLSKEKGLITGTGFIETRGALYREIHRGVDWIFTNHPLRLQKYLS